MQCIFCMEEKADSGLSIEHIFPDAIGGTITQKNVCKSCNDYLGRKVDCLLTNHWIIQGNRQIYKIAGKTGVVPNPLEKGFLNGDANSPVQYRFTKDGRPEKLYITPNLKTEKADGDFCIELKLDKSDEKNALIMINKTLERNNLKKLSPEEFEKIVQREEIYQQTPSMELKAGIDIYKYKRAIFKIVYELAYYWLGEQYLEDDIAVSLRNVILNDNLWEKENWDEIEIEGTIDFFSQEKRLWDFWKDDEISHLAFYKVMDGKVIIFVRIFNSFSANIVVSKNPVRYFPMTESFISINPATRETIETTFDEEMFRVFSKHEKNL